MTVNFAADPAHSARPKAKKSERKELTVWTPVQLTTFLGHVSEDRLFALWRLLAWTGMRRGEAIALKWDDLNLDAGTVAVRRSVVVAGYQPHASTPKSGRSRVLDLDAATITALRAHETSQKAERFALGLGRATEDALVFCREDGSAIHPGRISKLFDAHVRASGLPRIRLHDLRHTHASHLIVSGANVKVVQERLGHANVLVTLNTYSHLLPTTQREAIDKLAAM